MNQRDYDLRLARKLRRLNRFSRESIDSNTGNPGDDLPRDGGEQHSDVGASE